MEAARLYGPRAFRLEDQPEPGPPGPGEVLLAVEAVGICGSDVHYYTDGRIGDTLLTHPLILGHEPAGRVLEVGPNVDHLVPGDTVAIDPAVPCGWCEWCASGHPNLCPNVRFFGSPPTDGAFREQLLHPAECCFRLPEDLTAIDGALCETLGIGLHAVDLAHLHPGLSVVVIGCGPVGLMTLQVARCAGATPLIAVDLLPERLAVATSLGANLTIDASGEETVAEVMRLTDGRGADSVLEAVGMEAHGSPVAETVQKSLRLLPKKLQQLMMTNMSVERLSALYLAFEAVRRGGTVSISGVYGGAADPMPMMQLFDKQLQLRMGQANVRRWTGEILDLLQRDEDVLGVEGFATHHLPLDAAPEAYAKFQAKDDGMVKVLFRP